MRIIYGVSGEGLGHVFEAIEVTAHLERQGHTVRIVTYGDRACDALQALRPLRIEGFPLYFTDRGLSLPLTVRKNLPALGFFFRNGRRLVRELSDWKPDVFLTGYEPFCSWAAYRLRKPLVSMDNQSALLHLKAPKGFFLPFHIARLATRVVTVGARAYVIKTYQPPTGPVPPNVRFVAPLVQRQIRALKPTDGNHILVYLTKPNEAVLQVLRGCPASFHVYCHDREGQDGNLLFRPRGPRYLEDLASCRAIVGTTGFSLIGDAIHLRKPYFGVPLKGQFEQTLNAHYLEEAGLGRWSEEPTPEQLTAFLGRLPEFRERLARRTSRPTEQEETVEAVLREVVAGSPPVTAASLDLLPE